LGQAQKCGSVSTKSQSITCMFIATMWLISNNWFF
jgi:hypothetical protein